MEAQTPYTENHLQRMANLSERLAQAAGLDPDQVVAVRYASILHDVGKIGVNEAVLRRPGPLTEEEWAEVREHPAIGARIVALVDTYDAMAAERPYRAALPPEVIRAELEQVAGKQFDPDLTPLFPHLLGEDGVL